MASLDGPKLLPYNTNGSLPPKATTSHIRTVTFADPDHLTKTTPITTTLLPNKKFCELELASCLVQGLQKILPVSCNTHSRYIGEANAVSFAMDMIVSTLIASTLQDYFAPQPNENL